MVYVKQRRASGSAAAQRNRRATSPRFSHHAAPHNVTVNCVHPGTTVTERMMNMFNRRAQDDGVGVEDIEADTIANIPMARLIRPDDIANAVLFFCSPMANVITGQSIAVDGGSAQAVMY